MKRLIIITLVLMLTGSALAQNPPGRKGFKAGMSMAKWTGDDVRSDAEYLIGFTFGGFVTMPISPQLSFQPELLYSMKGVKTTDGIETEKFKTNYLEVPVLFKYNFTTKGSIKPSFYAGPAVAILISADRELGNTNNNASESDDAKVLFKSLDLGLVVGFSLDFGTSSASSFNIDGRYTLGMSKIGDDGPAPFFSLEGRDITNSSISLLLGYTL